MTVTVSAVAAAPPPSRARRAYLVVEYLVLFFGAVGGYALLDSPGSPLPVLAVLAVAGTIYLRRQPGFERRSFGRLGAIRGQLRPMLMLWALAVVLAVAALALLSPERLFDLPRNRPLIWAMVMVFYPLVSVYPQELIFRGFLFHRYAPVFGSGAGMLAASATAFGFVHIIFGNVLSVVLTLAGGWIFGRRYLRTRSLLAVSVEHALYGLLVFSVGMGEFFYHGAVST